MPDGARPEAQIAFGKINYQVILSKTKSPANSTRKQLNRSLKLFWPWQRWIKNFSLQPKNQTCRAQRRRRDIIVALAPPKTKAPLGAAYLKIIRQNMSLLTELNRFALCFYKYAAPTALFSRNEHLLLPRRRENSSG